MQTSSEIITARLGLLHQMQQSPRIIWDWNGTLLDDMQLCIEITNSMLREEGLHLRLTNDTYQAAFGFPIRAYYERLGFDTSGNRFPALATRFITEYDARVVECALHPGAKAELERHHARGAAQTILTAARSDSVQALVQHFGIDHLLDEIVGLDDHFAHGKIDLGRRWLAERGIDPKNAALVGDTLHDHEVATALGIECFLVAHGHHSHERLSTSGCTVLRNPFSVATVQSEARFAPER
jgi:phosphoglycolate phosphatase